MSEEATPLPPRNPVIHNAAIVGAIITPIAMLLPPRKIDIRFFVLAGAFSLSTNQLAYAYTGQSLYSRFGTRAGSVFDLGLPEGARRTQQLIKERKEREAALKAASSADIKDHSLVKDIWMGGESEDWKQKRAQEHQKSFEEGKGMSGIIMDQIAEVWSGNWRGDKKPKTEDEAPKRTPEDK
ncbi:hypothetical protein B0I35DRAFT_479098 [Stachybotrys elegans]|uniref:Rhomboid family membrane protein n=1 Tax=Stachybotrys elegans TaxID=80388 RepID=A0A8K0WRC2_9HYPO|nr:hypothetical protein B0I35DRAFT_479098 [Stachybotrys elegans]